MDKKKLILIWIPIILLACLNLITVFTPEIGFDALWYHLTLPKLWLWKHQWFFPGGLLYYSVMPRLTEIIFTPLIQLTGYVGPKLLQYFSGIGIGFLIWKICGKLKLSSVYKSLAVSLFYCTWLVSWESGSAYIDLFRTFLETTALYFLISGSWKKGGLFLGLAVGTKWLSLGSVAVYALVFGLPLLAPVALASLPWFLVAFHFTGNPVYPLFEPFLNNSFSSIWIVLKNILLLPIVITLPFDDFYSPLIGLLFVLSIFTIFSREKSARQIASIGVLGSIMTMTLNPPSSRYLLPFFPMLVISSAYLTSCLKPTIARYFIYLGIISSLLILSLRIYAVSKYLPFIFGKQDTTSFLTNYSLRTHHLPDTFIDSDGFVKNNLSGKKIFVDKLHNLFYFPYDFDHSSWVATSSGYDYLVTENTDPQTVQGNLIHTNPVGIQIFKLK